MLYAPLTASVATVGSLPGANLDVVKSHGLLGNIHAVAEVLKILNDAVKTTCDAEANSFDVHQAAGDVKNAADSLIDVASAGKSSLKSFMDHLNTEIHYAGKRSSSYLEGAKTLFQTAGEKSKTHADNSVKRIRFLDQKIHQLNH